MEAETEIWGGGILSTIKGAKSAITKKLLSSHLHDFKQQKILYDLTEYR
jgi:hypothetical protein